MIIGQLKTANYEFTTLQNTVDDALNALNIAWEIHAYESGASYSWEFLLDSVTMQPIRLGETVNNCERCENAISHKGEK
jgi:hypothetical protein